MGNSIVRVSIFLFFFIPQQFVTDHKPLCEDIEEYYDEQYGCRTCQPCKKGYGVDLTQKVNRTSNGMLFCYSCIQCSLGFYQDNVTKPKACQACSSCLNREISRNCSREANAICDKCLPGFFEIYRNGLCEKCTCYSHESCLKKYIYVLIILILVPVLNFIYFLYWIYQKIKSWLDYIRNFFNYLTPA